MPIQTLIECTNCGHTHNPLDSENCPKCKHYIEDDEEEHEEYNETNEGDIGYAAGNA